MKKIIYLSMFTLLLFLAAGCTKKDETATTDAGEAPAVAEERTDAGITTELKAKITDDELLDGTDISVETENSTVTLTGTVQNEAQKQRANEIATNTAGVTTVNDQIQIGDAKTADLDPDLDETKGDVEDAADKTGEKTAELGEKTGDKVNDASITAEVKLKLAGDDLTDALDIDVDTKNGIVTLNGTVASQAEADRAIQLAKSVEDVLNVESNLKIQADR